MNYGKPPELINYCGPVGCQEILHYQCLPIKLIDIPSFRVPERLEWIRPLLDCINPSEYVDKYVYVTAKNTFVSPGQCDGRPGWHSDGFLTDDINFIWYDIIPTEFCIQPFSVSSDCVNSLKEFEEQVDPQNIKTYDCFQLLKLTPEVIHRASPNHTYSGLRAFVKITISRHKFDLEGNAHNYLLDYKWDMVPRQQQRNHQSSKI